MSRYYDASLMSGLGRMIRRRRRVGGLVHRRRIHRARGLLTDALSAFGLGRRRRHVGRRRVYRKRRVGRRRHYHRRRHVGRRRRVMHRRRHGRGLWDIIKKVGSVALPFIKKSGVLGHLAGMIPGVGGVIKSGVQSLGYGRRHRRVHRRRGGLAQRRHSLIPPPFMTMMKRAMGRRVHRRGRGLLL